MSDQKYKPFVPANVQMTEFTFRAVAIGLVMSVVLGAANAYLGLKAGVTIAATYPAAVIGMAVLRIFKASVLEENIARTAGSIGESIAAGAIFTLPAFIISHSWASFDFEQAYWKSTALMLTGGVLGVLFVSLVRRVMVEDPELPFPESVAAAEIHKAGQQGGEAAKHLFINMGVGAVIYLMGAFQVFATDKKFFLSMGTLGTSNVTLSTRGGIAPFPVAVGGTTVMSAPSVSPAYLGVGYVIGPKLAALNFSGGVLAWGLMVPMLTYFLGPQLKEHLPQGATDKDWATLATAVWFSIVRPIAVGGMLVGAAYTLFKMRKNLSAGLGRAFQELGSTAKLEDLPRHERYMSSKTVFGLIGLVFAVMVVLYSYLAGGPLAGGVAAVVMLIAGFFFATVSGSLVGMIGSSNNPISGLTISTVLIAALLMVSLGVTGANGVLAVLGVAAVVCVSSAVAGELLQDFKVGYILGGTPRSIQITELIAVVVSSLVMYFPLLVLHAGNIKAGGIGFGDDKLAAPQAGLMATLSKGIVEGNMPWPLVGMGIMMGIGMILLQIKSPMLVSVGMYLPLATTFSIFVGGIIRWVTDVIAEGKGFNAAQKARCENVGVLTASGLIAGEALMGLVDATFKFYDLPMPEIFKEPSYGLGFIVMCFLGAQMVFTPISNAGNPNDPAPPTAMM